MKDPKKAKWVLGTSGILLSAALLTQINNPTQAETSRSNNIQNLDQENMTERERELVQLDWTNFEITSQAAVKSERKTKRT
ncbi:hypothetical protein [Lysinibacillus pakistanensis]|uniref:Uncharacterized protein n=1 Tax=Lysinibacillus pakistanensis TaxID=759811 RepID=A0AAX3WS18_9BACI|nr:hypothetical protein [Lysinibacillus pakistanensis]MDM5233962.1 hypothetical protein [Lysinibacillus pakistanensis]QGG51947.1 hypothetical protein GDS87_13785 [Lysinibacillus pakistanensis]WHY44570.1 hypothetical protein QNH22_14675 [Lysinibacillus pakistanensis]WHY49578.1 hypothetical protein QNH24_14650 [Lysinibacillus pakistanensis]